ncbi:MAG: G8 domain-containing protein [Burkholderiales bacterium]|nr:G8 domain-containing protein [Burkholderiales bacterium]
MIKVYKRIIAIISFALLLFFCGTLLAQISTPTDNIPDFAANPTIQSANSGDWFDPSTWQQNRIPGVDDVVMVAKGHAVQYSGINDAPLAVLGVKGTLTFNTGIDTRIKVGTIFVYREGKLDIGALSSPIDSDVKAEIIISDRPLATLQPDPITGVFDPKQYGTGLVVLGEVNMHGREISQTWLRASQEPLLGQNTLTLESGPSGWSVGDKLVIPDTRQIPLAWHSWREPLVPVELHLEEVEIAAINGNTVTLTQPIQHDHLAGRDSDGVIVGLPHIGNLTRNIVIRSENPDGTRGHVMFTERAKVDVQYVEFRDLGRTRADPLHNTILDESGNVVEIGTNQVGRYSLHLHHLMGPENPGNTGYQYKLVGNSFNRGEKWGVAIHDTHFGLFDNNVMFDFQGSSLMTEDGNERENEIINNFAVKAGTPFTSNHEPTYGGVTGPGRTLKFKDYGYEGSAFWFVGNDNIVTGNVAANAAFAGVMYNGRPWGFANPTPTVPNVRGADINDPSQWKKYTPSEWAPPVRVSANNEVYASAAGLWIGFAGVVGKVSDYTLWNIRQNGIYSKRNVSAEYENITIVSDQNSSNLNFPGAFNIGIDLNGYRYQSGHNIFRNFKVEGFSLGVDLPTFLQPETPQLGVMPPNIVLFEDGYLKNFVNVREHSPIIAPKNSVLKDVEFLLADGPAIRYFSDYPVNILAFLENSFSVTSLLSESHLHIQNMNRIQGNDFEFFYREQAPDHVMTDYVMGQGAVNPNDNCPTSGLTNQQCWDTHGKATMSVIATCTDDSDQAIDGFMCPLENSASLNDLLNKTRKDL